MTEPLNTFDPVRLEVFKHLFTAIPEEMGAVLGKSSYSPNIKERKDYSCAIFDETGEMIAQAAHIPVHLGAMPLSVKQAIKEIDMEPGDMVILNDPFRGGTHLPDITIISPMFIPKGKEEILAGFCASRAHHADVGGMTPGSMPVANEIYQEGLIIPPVKIVERGKINRWVWDLITSNVRTPVERAGDLKAQLAANKMGVSRYKALFERYGEAETRRYRQELVDYAERMMQNFIRTLPNGKYTFEDCLDNNGVTKDPIRIMVTITIQDDEIVVDFTGSDKQQPGSINAVYAITLSAVFYVFRCLINMDIPNNTGSLKPIRVIGPQGTVVNATHPAPVAGGNVETSQRITDVLFGALAKACPELVPAASQGTMNNTIIGGFDQIRNKPFTYYETIGGGAGAGNSFDGLNAVHTHMTNTLNTPIEAMEYEYPFLVQEYSIRDNTGGKGKYTGGNGIHREIKLLCDARASLLTERRVHQPYGLNGGEDGARGKNTLIRNGEELALPGKGEFDLKAGDVLIIQTPGGGGFGKQEKD